MARVFDRPHLAGADANIILHATADNAGPFILGATDEWYEDYDTSNPSVNDRLAHIGRQKGETRARALGGLAEAIRGLCKGKEILCDHDVIFDFPHKVVNGEIPLTKHGVKDLCAASDWAKDCAVSSMIASFASPHYAKVAVEGLTSFAGFANKFPRLASAYALCDTLRLNSSSISAAEHMRAYFRGDTPLDITECEVTDFAIGLHFHDATVHSFGPYLVISDRNTAWVMSADIRTYCAQIMSSSALWIWAALLSANGDDIRYAKEGLDYVTRNILDAPRANRMYLARQMKTSYAVALCKYDYINASDTERECIEYQVGGIERELEDFVKGEVPWHKVLATWPDKKAIDFGTAWNLIGPPDCDIAATDGAAKSKLNAAREFDEDAWTDFINYSRNAILAGYLVKNREAEITFTEGLVNGEEPDWITECREGKLSYPPTNVKMSFKPFMKWERHLETWGYTAQDVTHVYGDASLFKDAETLGSHREAVGSELIYYIKHGLALSGKFDPSTVREAWEEGWIPGDNVLYEAVKAENTKFTGKQRETMSASDVLRECLTEFDTNASQIGRYVHGVAMRAGRAGTERGVKDVSSNYAGNKLLVSLDVSGWSPNMHREGEMAFFDMMMEFFAVPEAQRISPIFQNVQVVASRMGYHSRWRAIDGSIQGFFGTGDTVLHSLMAQWSFRNMKNAGQVEKGAKIRKLTYMDDIMALLTGTKQSPLAIISAFSAQYLRLGFHADAVKTIARLNSCHFLNRFYVSGEEVLSAHKVFTRIDREWDRKWVSIFDEIDSCMGSALGAADRGASPIAAYFMGLWRAIHRIIRVSGGTLKGGTEFTTVGAWLPRNLGGAGIPCMSAWLTRESASTLENTLSVPFTIADALEPTDHKLASAIRRRVNEIVSADLQTPSIERFADDPLQVKARGCVDPANITRALARKAVQRIGPHSALSRLIDNAEDKKYPGIIKDVLTATVYPADVISQWSSSLPHTVVNTLVEKFIMSDAVLQRAPIRDRVTSWKSFKKANVNAARFTVNITAGSKFLDFGTATHAAASMRARNQEALGIPITNISTPCAPDLIRQVGIEEGQTQVGEEAIKVWVPIPDDATMSSAPMRNGKRCKPTVIRTSRPSGANVSFDLGTKDSGPISGAVKKLASVVAMASAYGADASDLKHAWGELWAGDKDIFPISAASQEATNPLRVSSRFSTNSHTVCGYPNFASHIVVNADSHIRTFEDKPRAFSWLSVIYFIRAAMSIDQEAACRAGTIEEVSLKFFINATVPYTRATAAWAKPRERPDRKYSGYMDGELAQTMSAACRDIKGHTCGVDSDSDSDVSREPEDGIIAAAASDRIYIKRKPYLRTLGATSILNLNFTGIANAARFAKASVDTEVDQVVQVRSVTRRVAKTNVTNIDKAFRKFRAALEAVGAFDNENARSQVRELRSKLDRESYNTLNTIPNGDAYKDVREVFRVIFDPTRRSDVIAKAVASISIIFYEGQEHDTLADMHIQMAAKHLDQQADVSLPPGVRFRSALIADVMTRWGSINDRALDAAIVCIVRATYALVSKVLQRTGLKGPGEATFTKLKRKYKVATYVDQIFFPRMMDMIEDPALIPASYGQRVDLIAGLKGGIRACHAYAVADFSGKYLRDIRGDTSHHTTGAALDSEQKQMILDGIDLTRGNDEDDEEDSGDEAEENVPSREDLIKFLRDAMFTASDNDEGWEARTFAMYKDDYADWAAYMENERAANGENAADV